MEYIIGGVVSLSATLVAFRLYNRHYVWGKYIDLLPERSLANSADIRGKTIIVTGASSGIGKEITRELFQKGARILMACRDPATAKVISEIQSSSDCAHAGKLIYKHLDLSSFSSVRTFVEEINREEPEIHILINNAAIYGDPVDLTHDGFERNMQVNHLSTALLTLLLLPKLHQAEIDGDNHSVIRNKIIFVTSTLYKKGQVFEQLFRRYASPTSLKSGSLSSYSKNVYPNTKLASLLFARELSLKPELTKGVNISVASPGFAFTRLHRNIPKSRLIWMSLLTPLLLPFLRSSRDGAQTIIGCSLMHETQSDILYRNCKSDLQLTFSDPSQGPKVFEWTMESLKPFMES